MPGSEATAWATNCRGGGNSRRSWSRTSMSASAASRLTSPISGLVVELVLVRRQHLLDPDRRGDCDRAADEQPAELVALLGRLLRQLGRCDLELACRLHDLIGHRARRCGLPWPVSLD